MMAEFEIDRRASRHDIEHAHADRIGCRGFGTASKPHGYLRSKMTW